MTSDEFSEWLIDFRAGFRDVDAWLSKFGSEETEKTLRWWFKVLRSLTLEEASQAAFDLYQQEGKLPPFSKLPAAIKAVARRRHYQHKREETPTYIDGEQVFRCHKCQDDGRVVHRIKVPADHPFPNFPYRAAFACDCDAGTLWAHPERCPRYHEVPPDQRPTPLPRWRGE